MLFSSVFMSNSGKSTLQHKTCDIRAKKLFLCSSCFSIALL